MLSLRSLTRSAPRAAIRATSRITLRSSTFIKPAVHTSIRSAWPKATFATTSRRFDAASQELAAKLVAEIELEEQSNKDAAAASDSNVETFLSRNPDWTIHDVPGQTEVSLTRKYDDEDVKVTFSINDFNTQLLDEEAAQAEEDAALLDDDEDLETQSGGGRTKGLINQGNTRDGNFKAAPEDEIESQGQEIDDEDHPAIPATLTVTITRPGKGVLRFELMAEDGDFQIHSLSQFPDAATAESSDHDLYTGPPFEQLDEEVQSLIQDYLDQRGINEALAMFVPDYIDVKEQREYTKWLNNVKNFVEE